MADDFERAVYYSFAQAGTGSSEVAAQASAALDAAKSDSDAWRLCLSHLRSSAYIEVRFWCLQTLHELVQRRYEELRTVEAREELKRELLAAALAGCPPVFIRNKLAQVLVAVASQEFPSLWPRFFQDLIATLPSGGKAAADLLCRVLISVDDDIISLDVPRSAAGARASMAFKDAMRELSLPDVAAAWTAMLAPALGPLAAPSNAQVESTEVDEEAGVAVLGVVARYVNWVDIGLVANPRFLPLLFAALGPRAPLALRGAAADVLAEVVSKRTEAEPKLELIQQLGIVPECTRWSNGPPFEKKMETRGVGNSIGIQGSSARDQSDADAEEEAELAGKYARLLAVLASEILEAQKKIQNAVLSLEAVGLDLDAAAVQEAAAAGAQAAALLDALFPALLAALRSGDDAAAAAVVPFLLSYLNWLKIASRRKSGGATATDGLRRVPALLEATARCARYRDQSASFAVAAQTEAERVAAEEEEEVVAERRQDLFTLFKNGARLAPSAAEALVRAVLSTALSDPSSPWQDIELGVSLLYQLGEPGAAEDARGHHSSIGNGNASSLSSNGSTTSPLNELAIAVVSSSGHPALAHRLALLAYLETCVRFARCLAQHEATAAQRPPSTSSLLVVAVTAFLNALAHGAPAVQRRSAYLLCRLTKTLRSTLRPVVGELLARLAPHLAAIAATPLADVPGTKAGTGRATGGVSLTAVDDRLYAFEAAGLLLGQEDVAPADQVAWLGAIVEPLIKQIEEALQAARRGVAGIAASGSGTGALFPPAQLAQQALEGITRVAKGFSLRLCTEARPALGQEFLRAVQVAVQIPAALPGHRGIRSRLLSFLHRMVETLGPAVLPFMPEVFNTLLQPGADAAQLSDALTLLFQLVSRFKEGIMDLVQSIMPVLVDRIEVALGPDWDWTSGLTPGSPRPTAVETAREGEELQRGYFATLLCIANNGLGPVLLTPGGPVLDHILTALLKAATSSSDNTVRKTCIQTLHRLLNSWLEGQGSPVDPGIVSFAVEKFAGQVCLESILLPGPSRPDPSDASCLSMLGEASTGLLMVFAKAPQQLINYINSVVGPHLGWPAQAVSQLCSLLSSSAETSTGTNAVKLIRDFLREALRQQRPS